MKTMSPSRLSMALIGALLLLIALLIGGSIIMATFILKQSVAATHAQINAQVSADDPSRLEALKQYLVKNQTGIEQTHELTEGIGQYDQNRIVATVSGYAKSAGVTIDGFDFSNTTATGTTTTVAPVAGSGTSFNLTLGSPLPYTRFIVFLRLLEQGLMPATVTTATLNGDPGNGTNIVVSSLVIKVAA